MYKIVEQEQEQQKPTDQIFNLARQVFADADIKFVTFIRESGEVIPVSAFRRRVEGDGLSFVHTTYDYEESGTSDLTGPHPITSISQYYRELNEQRVQIEVPGRLQPVQTLEILFKDGNFLSATQYLFTDEHGNSNWVYRLAERKGVSASNTWSDEELEQKILDIFEKAFEPET
jgi:hypothetical protein